MVAIVARLHLGYLKLFRGYINLYLFTRMYWLFVDIYINVLLASDHNHRPSKEKILWYTMFTQCR